MFALLTPFPFFSRIPFLRLGKTKDDLVWSYNVESGIEKSRRSYMLVYNPENVDRRQISIVSVCQKPFQQEGVYEKCKHNIKIVPTGSTFTVDTGEDVIMINTAWNTPIVLGTLDYGCCAAPLTITFYREDGQRIGTIKKSHQALLSLYGNAITRSWDLRNSTGRHDKVQYFVIQDNQKDFKFYAIKKGSDGKLLKIPIYYKNVDQANLTI